MQQDTFFGQILMFGLHIYPVYFNISPTDHQINWENVGILFWFFLELLSKLLQISRTPILWVFKWHTISEPQICIYMCLDLCKKHIFHEFVSYIVLVSITSLLIFCRWGQYIPIWSGEICAKSAKDDKKWNHCAAHGFLF